MGELLFISLDKQETLQLSWASNQDYEVNSFLRPSKH